MRYRLDDYAPEPGFVRVTFNTVNKTLVALVSFDRVSIEGNKSTIDTKVSECERPTVL